MPGLLVFRCMRRRSDDVADVIEESPGMASVDEGALTSWSESLFGISASLQDRR